MNVTGFDFLRSCLKSAAEKKISMVVLARFQHEGKAAKVTVSNLTNPEDVERRLADGFRPSEAAIDAAAAAVHDHLIKVGWHAPTCHVCGSDVEWNKLPQPGAERMRHRELAKITIEAAKETQGRTVVRPS